jgi:hypothetical protein
VFGHPGLTVEQAGKDYAPFLQRALQEMRNKAPAKTA